MFQTVYPHECGEHTGYILIICHFLGLSPRVWGTLTQSIRVRPTIRFIPTSVGNTCSATESFLPDTVYPHECGEHYDRDGNTVAYGGLSPRVWGTRRACPSAQSLPRFIPTSVGNTNRSCLYDSQKAVYPHECGEHSSPPPARGQPCGLSPRVWGTLSNRKNWASNHRFIPTSVGNTAPPGMRLRPGTVYPHECGEHQIWRVDIMQGVGLSPRVWGTHSFGLPLWNLRRFIPTSVGNTLCRLHFPGLLSVYPHECGEHM